MGRKREEGETGHSLKQTLPQNSLFHLGAVHAPRWTAPRLMLGKERLSVVAMHSELLKQVQPGAQQDVTGAPYAIQGK